MAGLLTIAYRSLEIISMSVPAPAVRVAEGNKIGHNLERELEGRKYEDNTLDNRVISLGFSGEITLTGDLEQYVYPKYATQVKTEALFIEDDYYLFEFLALDIDTAKDEMVYGRWTAQWTSPIQEERANSELNEIDITFSIATFADKARVKGVHYDATLTTDATPKTDYDPVFMARTPAGTKTLAAARDHIALGIVNPTGGP